VFWKNFSRGCALEIMEIGRKKRRESKGQTSEIGRGKSRKSEFRPFARDVA